jgi:hypothetical protein
LARHAHLDPGRVVVLEAIKRRKITVVRQAVAIVIAPVAGLIGPDAASADAAFVNLAVAVVIRPVAHFILGTVERISALQLSFIDLSVDVVIDGVADVSRIVAKPIVRIE